MMASASAEQSSAEQFGLTSSEIRRELINAEVSRILSSPGFKRAEGLSRMLRFIVDRSIEGDRAQLKEYCVAIGVFGREVDFDPKDFALVRVQATRLRRKLEQFYRTTGGFAPIVISVPKGGYVAHFEQGSVNYPTSSFLEQAWASDVNLLPGDGSESSCYARGLALLGRWDEKSLIRCAGLCRQAIRHGADFPSLRGLLALSLGGLYWYDCLPPDEITAIAREAAAEALRADSGNVHARLVMGFLAWVYDRDPQAARHHLNIAWNIGQHRPEVALLKAFRLACMGLPAQAASELAGVPPLPNWTAASEVMAAFRSLAWGDWTKALTHLKIASALEEYSPFIHWCSGFASLCAANSDEALGPLSRAASLDGMGGLAAGSLGYAYGSSGRRKEALAILNDMQTRSIVRYVSKVDMAAIHAGLGDMREARRLLEIADRERSGRLPMTLFAPEFSVMRRGRNSGEFARALRTPWPSILRRFDAPARRLGRETASV